MITLVPENDPILKQVAIEYDFEDAPKFLDKDDSFGLSEFTDSMLVAMQLYDGMGLAAPQIGHSLRIFVMNIFDEEFICINPSIVEETKEEVIDQEGCLSFPHLTLSVKRSVEIFVSYQNIDGSVMRRWLKDTPARCFQHELDHLNGITFDTRAAKLNLKMAKTKRLKTMKQLQRKK